MGVIFEISPPHPVYRPKSFTYLHMNGPEQKYIYAFMIKITPQFFLHPYHAHSTRKNGYCLNEINAFHGTIFAVAKGWIVFYLIFEIYCIGRRVFDYLSDGFSIIIYVQLARIGCFFGANRCSYFFLLPPKIVLSSFAWLEQKKIERDFYCWILFYSINFVHNKFK